MTGFASGSKKITSSTTYSAISSDWTKTLTDTDSLGFQTISSIAAFHDILLRTTESDGSYIEYTYTYADNFPGHIETVKVAEYDKDANHTELSSIIYTYYLPDLWFSASDGTYCSAGRLRSVQTGNGAVYYYMYDKWGSIKTVYAGSFGPYHILIDYTYRATDGALLMKQYASGKGERYSYDDLGRLSMIETRSTPNDPFFAAYSWEYTSDGRLIKSEGNGNIYEYTYDAGGRVILAAEGDAGGRMKTYFEYEYDAYGNLKRENTIMIDYAHEKAITPYNLLPASGTYSRVRDGFYEYVYINGVEQIKYTYSSENPKTGYIVREDNKLNRSSSHPNGVTLQYTRDILGKVVSFHLSDYGYTLVDVYYCHTGYNISSTSYDYENGSTDVWDPQWAIDNSVNGSYYTPTAVSGSQSAGNETVTNILRLHQLSFFGSNYVSLINPAYLTAGGNSVTISYMIKRETLGAGDCGGLAVLYTDGGYTQSAYLDDTLNWQERYLVSDPSKIIDKVILYYVTNVWLYIGNVKVEVSNNAWSGQWLINNQVNASSAPITAQADETVGNTRITNIVRLYQSSVYAGTVNGIEVYKSLVDPELLINGGDCIALDYWIRKESTGTSVRQLRFRYGDGTVQYPAGTDIPNDTAWHHYSVKSLPGKVVTKIELGYNYGSWVRLGNVRVTVQGLERRDDRISGETLKNGNYVSFGYDGLGRLTSSKVTEDKTGSGQILKDSYTYLDGSGNNTSYTVASKTVTQGASSSTVYNYTYNMDASGSRNFAASNPYNIYEIKENGVLKARYHYDTLGKLIREDNFYTNQTVTYTYDNNNNITSKTFYTATTSPELIGGTTYEYGYYWGWYPDRLTSYGDSAIITYDSIGNPLSYLGKTMTWSGHALKTLTENGITHTYTYNSDGLRLSKVSSDGQMTRYLRAGNRLIREISGPASLLAGSGLDTLWYLYDNTGLIGFELDDYSYYYVRNLQGDVMRIVDTGGNTVASYVYDSWGKIISQSGALADVNPIRYRGYYYDKETGLYYLNARYYDPETGRFISSDVVAEGGNLYAYCQNDPINRTDESGYLSSFWKKALSIAAVVVTTVAIVAVSAVFCGPASPYIAGAAIGAGMEMLQQIAFQDKDLSTINYAKVGVAAASGALSAIPGIGWVGAGLISGGTNAAMTALDGGSTADIVKSAAIGFATGAVINKLFSGGMCFVEGTAVLTASGALAIEAIAVGDLVYAYDDITGDVALKEVVQLFRNETYELTTVRTDDGQEIVSTPTHPYYTINRGWLQASELRAGDKLINVNGDVVIVEWIQHEIFENRIAVYNFEVADYHTYFVAESIYANTNKFVLVHNLCQNPNQKALTQIIKENGKSNALSMKDANTLVSWGEEYGMNIRIDMGHSFGNAVSQAPHLHTGFNNWHIPIIWS